MVSLSLSCLLLTRMGLPLQSPRSPKHAWPGFFHVDADRLARCGTWAPASQSKGHVMPDPFDRFATAGP